VACVCGRFLINGVIVCITAEAADSGDASRDAVMAAFRDAKNEVKDALQTLVMSTLSKGTTQGTPSTSAAAGSTSAAAGSTSAAVGITSVPADAGDARDSSFEAACDSGDDWTTLQLPDAQLGKTDTTTTSASSGMRAALPDRVTTARKFGHAAARAMSWGPAPDQPRWEAPLKSRYWVVLRGESADSVGIYPTRTLAAAATASKASGVLYGFPSLAEARACLEGAGLRAVYQRQQR